VVEELAAGEGEFCRMRVHRRVPFDSPPLPLHPLPNAPKSPAPRIGVDVWCGLIDEMDRATLDGFTRDIWRCNPSSTPSSGGAASSRVRRGRSRRASRSSHASISG